MAAKANITTATAASAASAAADTTAASAAADSTAASAAVPFTIRLLFVDAVDSFYASPHSYVYFIHQSDDDAVDTVCN